MNRIYFQSEKELIYFCELIFRKFDEINVQWKRNKYWGNELNLFDPHLDKEAIVACLNDLFLHLRLDNELRRLLEKVYHYTDDDEIDHICSLSKSIIAETHSNNHINGLITDTFWRYMGDSAIVHFDEMIVFCSKTITAQLEKIAGQGIDELKLEEAHQHFIDAARIFIKNRRSVNNILHIVQGDSFNFYKKDGKRYSELELRTEMLKTPLYMIGLDENEWNLAPVIALNPRQILIYGDCLTEAKTVSLINIFQEKVQFMPLHTFPFYNLN